MQEVLTDLFFRGRKGLLAYASPGQGYAHGHDNGNQHAQQQGQTARRKGEQKGRHVKGQKNLTPLGQRQNPHREPGAAQTQQRTRRHGGEPEVKKFPAQHLPDLPGFGAHRLHQHDAAQTAAHLGEEDLEHGADRGHKQNDGNKPQGQPAALRRRGKGKAVKTKAREIVLLLQGIGPDIGGRVERQPRHGEISGLEVGKGDLTEFSVQVEGHARTVQGQLHGEPYIVIIVENLKGNKAVVPGHKLIQDQRGKNIVEQVVGREKLLRLVKQHITAGNQPGLHRPGALPVGKGKEKADLRLELGRGKGIEGVDGVFRRVDGAVIQRTKLLPKLPAGQRLPGGEENAAGVIHRLIVRVFFPHRLLAAQQKLIIFPGDKAGGQRGLPAVPAVGIGLHHAADGIGEGNAQAERLRCYAHLQVRILQPQQVGTGIVRKPLLGGHVGAQIKVIAVPVQKSVQLLQKLLLVHLLKGRRVRHLICPVVEKTDLQGEPIPVIVRREKTAPFSGAELLQIGGFQILLGKSRQLVLPGIVPRQGFRTSGQGQLIGDGEAVAQLKAQRRHAGVFQHDLSPLLRPAALFQLKLAQFGKLRGIDAEHIAVVSGKIVRALYAEHGQHGGLFPVEGQLLCSLRRKIRCHDLPATVGGDTLSGVRLLQGGDQRGGQHQKQKGQRHHAP